FVMADDEVGYILDTMPPPSGVVFEVLTHEPSTWPRVLSYINKSVKRLRAKHADMSFAIVSHGMEQFSLLKKRRKENTALHNQVQSLLKDNIKLEVCGTFAEWNGYDKNDFPSYVTIVDQAPRSIGFYEEDGFSVIVITEDLLNSLPN
ncbi:MAG: hypothetical protein KAT25_05200, partial [Sulfuriflexus sp.]|nr:hypothetical protein [Sulfuriflexus sp.]